MKLNLANFFWEIVLPLGLIAIYLLFEANRRLKSHSRSRQIVSESYRPGESPVVSPEGVGIVACVGPKRDPLPESKDFVSVESACEKTCKHRCGHVGPKWYYLDIYGIKSFKFDEKEECPACLTARIKKEIIRCALCGLPIAPGEGVALYHKDSSSVRKDIATIVNGNAAIGCLRIGCCPSMGFLAGHWTEKGFESCDFESTTPS